MSKAAIRVTQVAGLSGFACSKCGDRIGIGVYVVAQTAMGHALVHTHECGAKHEVKAGPARRGSYSVKALDAGAPLPALAGEFDVWADHYGHLTARPATHALAEDGPSPSGYPVHMQRVTAANARAALAAHRADARATA